jgi:hypothetical protein
MVEGQKWALHGVDVVESVGKIDSNFFDLKTSNIVVTIQMLRAWRLVLWHPVM